jgi:hypothetical protein
MVIEFLITIPRERLRPQYGDGFRGAPLANSRPVENKIGRNRGVVQDASGTNQETDVAGETEI